MKFFIDTANLDQIAQAAQLGVLDGVTTNPSLMAKEGIAGSDRVLAHYEAICGLVDDYVNAEVIATTYDEIMAEGHELAALSPKIIVKIPMIRDGVRAIKAFTEQGIRTNCTLIFSAGQAIMAAKAGATFISPFIGRLDDIGYDGIELIEQIVYIYSTQGFDTEVLAASIRNPLHIIRCAEAGADVITAPLSSITALFNHPLTDKGLEQFLADHAKAANSAA